ncbi:MAG: cytochrome c maturation protein CcmE domain-containing protein [Candidatus Kapaibacteriales bacterium]
MKRYIFTAIFAVLFLIIVLLSFNKNTIEYTNFDSAIESGKKVQVVGTLVREYPKHYDPNSNLLSFFMKDKNHKIFLVHYPGPEPNNFTLANEFVVQGFAQNDSTFYATKIITKCPSKYEAEAEDLGR